MDAVLRVPRPITGLRSRDWPRRWPSIDPDGGAKLTAEAEAYRKDLRAAVERSIALSPVVPVRDGTFHSVIPFACYVRGLSTGAWGWQRDGSGAHVGPLYWETVQSAAALISPAGLLPPKDVRVQGYLDVLEDRLALGEPERRTAGTGSTPDGNTRAAWSEPRTCTWPATTCRCFSVRF